MTNRQTPRRFLIAIWSCLLEDDTWYPKLDQDPAICFCMTEAIDFHILPKLWDSWAQCLGNTFLSGWSLILGMETLATETTKQFFACFVLGVNLVGEWVRLMYVTYLLKDCPGKVASSPAFCCYVSFRRLAMELISSKVVLSNSILGVPCQCMIGNIVLHPVDCYILQGLQSSNYEPWPESSRLAFI